MNDRLRTSLAAGLLLASVSIAGVANANEGRGEGKGHGKSKAKSCKKHGKGYLVHGSFAGGDLTRVAGADTERWGDDRYSGTVIVEVSKGNKRGRRDVGLSSYAVTNVRVIGAAADGTLPAEGTRVDLVGKQKPACDVAPTTPDPTTPTTPTETTPDPTATPLWQEEHGPKNHDAPLPSDDDETVADDAAPADAPKSDPSETDDAPAAKESPRGKDKDRVDDHDHVNDDDDAESDDDEVEATTPTAVTDVAVRVVHFKVRPAAARR